MDTVRFYRPKPTCATITILEKEYPGFYWILDHKDNIKKRLLVFEKLPLQEIEKLLGEGCATIRIERIKTQKKFIEEIIISPV